MKSVSLYRTFPTYPTSPRASAAPPRRRVFPAGVHPCYTLRAVISLPVYRLHRLTRLLSALLFLAAGLSDPVVAWPRGSPPPRQRRNPRFGVVEAFADPQAASELGAGYTRYSVTLGRDFQPSGPADWKPANVPDPLIEGEVAAGRQVVAILIGTPAWAISGDAGGDARSMPDLYYWQAFVRRMAKQYRIASGTGSSGMSRTCGWWIILGIPGRVRSKTTPSSSRPPN